MALVYLLVAVVLVILINHLVPVILVVLVLVILARNLWPSLGKAPSY
jgi:hypothetical protein